MQKSDVYQVDLNLLKLFDALIKEGSVTQAGARLGLSQPAASRGLGRLRHVLNDRIIVRTAKGWELTPRALALSSQVAKLLDDARAIVVPAEFSPETASGQFSIATADHLAFLWMPEVIKMLACLAPKMDLIVPPSTRDNVDLIAQGAADLAIGLFENLPARFYSRRLYDEDYVCVVRQGHTVASQPLTLDNYVAMSHVSVIITGHGHSAVDVALKQHGLTRRVVAKVPHFLVAFNIVADSDLILTTPRQLANKMAKTMPIQLLELPINLPSFSPTMIWHEKLHYDPAHVWLRNKILEVCQQTVQG
ncbi:LysR family transcriptional regulator [Vibrio neptunius]|uniref:LysR family transcriptional regulator n=1 Tax=Vibrio neptunius TaxID=170651 RepID=UPI003314B99E